MKKKLINKKGKHLILKIQQNPYKSITTSSALDFCGKDSFVEIIKHLKYEGFIEDCSQGYQLTSKGYEFNGDKLNELKQAETQAHLEKYILFNVELFDLLHNLSSVYKLCVASNATDLFVNRSLEILQIKHLFQKINTATDYPAKPDTTTFEDCMRHTNSNYMNTLIVEDSPVGIQCATATGCQVLEVTNQRDTINKLNNLIKLPWPLPRTKEQ